MTTKKRFYFTAAILLAAANAIYAAGDGKSGIDEATKMITGYFDPGV